MARRAQRVSELLRQELSSIFQTLRDPRLQAIISITRIQTSDDLSHAKVYISVLGSSKQKTEATECLNAASGYIRKELRGVVSLRRIPDLSFSIDDSMEKAEAIQRMMDDFSTEEQ